MEQGSSTARHTAFWENGAGGAGGPGEIEKIKIRAADSATRESCQDIQVKGTWPNWGQKMVYANKVRSNKVRRGTSKCLIVSTTAVLSALLLLLRETAQERTAPIPPTIAEKCTFSDATTISFGHDAGTNSGTPVWKAGDYEATAFRASARVIIPPMENRIEMSPGLYTIFVDSSKDEPWTLIVSKKRPKVDMAYPGKRFDVGRTAMGFDDSWRQPVKGVQIGCTHWGKDQKNPMFIYMASGTHLAYAKIQTASAAW